jgi:antibiotic biosynthesis monooxygenase (ABM) superfamily enzyme
MGVVLRRKAARRQDAAAPTSIQFNLIKKLMESTTPALAAADVKWHVKPGSAAALEEVARATLHAASTFPGFAGGNLLQPGPGSMSREWQLLVQFTTTAHLQAWRNSASCRFWKSQSDALTVGPARVRSINGLEGWFVRAGRDARRTPPKWKIALVTMLGIYPTIRLVPALLGPVVGSWPPCLGSLVVTSVVMVLMTWLIMPFLTRMFSSWLQAGPAAPTPESNGS